MVVAEAVDGEEALKKVDAILPHFIFMDIKLPGENGVELTRKIKAAHADIIIIILTSYNLPEYRQVAYESGADGFLIKGSSTRDEVLKLVDSFMSI
jgi:DNA-binding NarL/FixJ family response regulator